VTPSRMLQNTNTEIAMKFLSMYKSVEKNAPPSQEEMNKMGNLIEEGMKAGWLVATEGCLPSALGARVRSTCGRSEFRRMTPTVRPNSRLVMSDNRRSHPLVRFAR